MWPTDADTLASRQRELATAAARPWAPPDTDLLVGGCWVCFPRGLTGRGDAGDRAWAAAVTMRGDRVVSEATTEGGAGAAYVPGLLALRLGPLLERVVELLDATPDVLLVDGTGRDHPRRAGLAVHLGAELDLATIGITHLPLRAGGDWPPDELGATSPLRLGGEVVAAWLRTRPGTRPVVVHPGWRVDLATAVDVVGSGSSRRTPEPLRAARHRARIARDRGIRTSYGPVAISDRFV